MLSSELELNDNVKKFCEINSKIDESANESNYSYEAVKCIKKLHQETKWLQGKYKVPILWSDKVKELTNIFNTALQRFKPLKKIQICKESIKTQCGNTSKIDMQESCLMKKLTKQAKGLGTCHTT